SWGPQAHQRQRERRKAVGLHSELWKAWRRSWKLTRSRPRQMHHLHWLPVQMWPTRCWAPCSAQSWLRLSGLWKTPSVPSPPGKPEKTTQRKSLAKTPQSLVRLRIRTGAMADASAGRQARKAPREMLLLQTQPRLQAALGDNAGRGSLRQSSFH
ncbi:unnamed protein product, partial [Symbiodinium pilosum]